MLAARTRAGDLEAADGAEAIDPRDRCAALGAGVEIRNHRLPFLFLPDLVNLWSGIGVKGETVKPAFFRRGGVGRTSDRTIGDTM